MTTPFPSNHSAVRRWLNQVGETVTLTNIDTSVDSSSDYDDQTRTETTAKATAYVQESLTPTYDRNAVEREVEADARIFLWQDDLPDSFAIAGANVGEPTRVADSNNRTWSVIHAKHVGGNLLRLEVQL